MLSALTRNLFFTGKGGVGKTSLACAMAISLADGRRVLLVSTDPASNLDEVLAVPLGGRPRGVPNAPRSFAMNIDPEAAAREYREKIIGPLSRRPAGCGSGKQQETAYIREVIDEHATQVALIPWQTSPPVGIDGLRSLINAGRPQTANVE